MRYIPYPAYKDSGVEWLGEIPEGWVARRIGFHFRDRREKVSDKDFPPLSVTMQGIVPQMEHVAKTEDNDNRKLVRSGDVVINSRSDRKGSSGLSLLDGSVSLINTVLIPDSQVFGEFAHHLIRSAAFQEEFYRYGKGIVADLWSTNYGEMKDISFPLPPLPTQQAIATFLDTEAARIDSLIKDYEELVALLQEKRKALISHVVTRGLSELVSPHDPEFGEWAKPMKFKDSGVEWLGEIPEGWEPVACRRVINKIEQGWSPVAEDRNPDSDEWAVIKLSAVKFGKFQPTELKVIPSDQPVYPELQLKSGDVLMTRANTPQLVGDVCLVESCAERVIFSDLVYRIRLSDDLVSAKFFVAFFSSPLGRSQVENSARGTSQSMVKISHSAIKEFLIPLPSLDEQRAIAAFLDKETAKMDTLVTEAESAIELLKEHRSALITNAVTGKINVEAFISTKGVLS